MEPARFVPRNRWWKIPDIWIVPFREFMYASKHDRFAATTFEHLVNDAPPDADVLVIRFGPFVTSFLEKFMPRLSPTLVAMKLFIAVNRLLFCRRHVDKVVRFAGTALAAPRLLPRDRPLVPHRRVCAHFPLVAALLWRKCDHPKQSSALQAGPPPAWDT